MEKGKEEKTFTFEFEISVATIETGLTRNKDLAHACWVLTFLAFIFREVQLLKLVGNSVVHFKNGKGLEKALQHSAHRWPQELEEQEVNP